MDSAKESRYVGRKWKNANDALKKSLSGKRRTEIG